ncbi:pseudouridine synthase [Homoserinibacter sp. GY 40078]|uniref:pseudouridine synthase n=1 Tax=Homoserinibacter sp. GY 40078 TaxID=2603275 RepID=UPI0011C8E82C|nr:pseudouridine synthase [Homoserinibacter sp. GY 40078]TXK19882.1 rRNA pseudouridine synthase [Homoserinibacter sp. GY 40078]
MTAEESGGERLQKVLAAAGVASRRVSEQYIVEGRVRVNGRVVTELGTRVDPESDLVEVDDVPVQVDTAKRYLMLNKPKGVVSSLADERGRPDLSRYVDEAGERVFNVGRLDAETTGLLLLTNDGALAHVLAHPSFGVEKTYLATVRGTVAPEALRRLRQGVELDDGPIAADRARVVGEPSGGRTIVEVTLHSGRNRIVRRMLDAVGHPVVELVRRRFGPLTLGPLAMGAMRDLTKVEVGALLALVRAADAPTSTEDGPE